MTPKQANELGKAVERATEHHIVVVAQGRMKADNTRFFLTTSSSHPDGSVLHVVRQHGLRLACDCEGSRRGHICQHRASVYMHVQVQAERRRCQAEAIEAALAEEQQAKREQAPLYRDNRAVCLYK